MPLSEFLHNKGFKYITLFTNKHTTIQPSAMCTVSVNQLVFWSATHLYL